MEPQDELERRRIEEETEDQAAIDDLEVPSADKAEQRQEVRHAADDDLDVERPPGPAPE